MSALPFGMTNAYSNYFLIPRPAAVSASVSVFDGNIGRAQEARAIANLQSVLSKLSLDRAVGSPLVS
jgi:hypothetical protein